MDNFCWEKVHFLTTAAIICEYNPLHLGHALQLQQVRAQLGDDGAIVCLMSGNYVQRGEPAVFDKFTRARAALMCGADVVLELPLTCAIRSAEGFAFGAVEILHRLGVVDRLYFGCECGDLAPLAAIARCLQGPDFSPTLQAHLKTGCSFAAARQQAVTELGCQGSLLRQPNNNLGVEYLKALLRLESPIKPCGLPRDLSLKSASQLRADLDNPSWRKHVPSALLPLYDSAPKYRFVWGERAVLARLRSLSEQEFEMLPYGTEGLWRKFLTACRTQPDCAHILSATLSKRYPRTRLQRMLLCAYLGIDRATLEATPPYVRLLALTSRGRQVLRQAKKLGTLVWVNAGAQPPDRDYGRLEQRAADLYTLFSAPAHSAVCGTEQQGRISILK